MSTKNKSKRLVDSALIAALYVVLTITQELLLPGTTSMAVQFRLSELLCLLCVFTPSAVWGVTAGVLLSNLISVGVLPLDVIFGTLATLLAAVMTYKLRNVRIFNLPVLSALMPVIANGVIIGLELELFLIEGEFHFGSFLLQGGLVALGEFVVCVVLGLPFVRLIERLRIFK